MRDLAAGMAVHIRKSFLQHPKQREFDIAGQAAERCVELDLNPASSAAVFLNLPGYRAVFRGFRAAVGDLSTV